MSTNCHYGFVGETRAMNPSKILVAAQQLLKFRGIPPQHRSRLWTQSIALRKPNRAAAGLPRPALVLRRPKAVRALYFNVCR
jgi:hypothetical protein